MVPCRCLQGKTYSSSFLVDNLFSVLDRDILGKFDVILINLKFDIHNLTLKLIKEANELCVNIWSKYLKIRRRRRRESRERSSDCSGRSRVFLTVSLCATVVFRRQDWHTAFAKLHQTRTCCSLVMQWSASTHVQEITALSLSHRNWLKNCSFLPASLPGPTRVNIQRFQLPYQYGSDKGAWFSHSFFFLKKVGY